MKRRSVRHGRSMRMQHSGECLVRTQQQRPGCLGRRRACRFGGVIRPAFVNRKSSRSAPHCRHRHSIRYSLCRGKTSQSACNTYCCGRTRYSRRSRWSNRCQPPHRKQPGEGSGPRPTPTSARLPLRRSRPGAASPAGTGADAGQLATQARGTRRRLEGRTGALSRTVFLATH